MVSRYTGACLGLFAFAITVIAGLWVNNPPMVTISRAVWALVLFCAIGLLVGACAQSVVNEHHRRREQTELPAVGEASAGPEVDSGSEMPVAELAELADLAEPIGMGADEGSPALPEAS
ncbi:MAG: hypothetical protein ACE5GE_00525 [Phycisphaerae bacterium]